MDAKRLRKYKSLEERIGNTPLVEFPEDTPNDNKILVKVEADNPWGSHYDRVYLDLFRHHEERGDIEPGQPILETTSGSAGVSFAGIGKILGYDCHVAIPEGGEIAREEAILEQGATLYHTPEEEYVDGFPNFIKRFLAKNRDFFFLNHSMGKRGKNNEVTLKALEGIAEEVEGIDYFIPAIGNGSSALGPGRVFKQGGTRVVGFETLQSATAYEQMYPGLYKELYEIEPGELSRHQLPGTSFPTLKIDFPHLKNAVEEGVLDDVVLVSGERMDEEYENLTGRQVPEDIPRWDNPENQVHDLGRSTQAGIAVALDLAERMEDQTMMVTGYDKMERYDS